MADNVTIEWNDGSQFSIPSSSLPEALQKGYRVVQPEDAGVLQGILNRGKQTVSAIMQQGKPPDSILGKLAAAAVPGGMIVPRMLQGLGQSEVQAGGQLKSQLLAAAAKPNMAQALPDSLQAAITAASMLNPLATGSVANVNELNSQGRTGEAKGAGLTDAALMGLPLVLKGILGNTPSALKAKAGVGYQKVSAAVGDMPVDANAPAQFIFRMQELQDAGRTMPRFAQRFLQRVTDPSKGPLTYDEARDFSSAAGELSGNESARLTKAMRTQVDMFRSALEKNIGDTAAQAQLRDVYQAATGQYRTASNLSGSAEAALDLAKKTLPYAASAYAVKKILEGGR